MSLHDIAIHRLDDTPATFGEITGGGPALVVNVASRCMHTPQYAGLETLHEKLAHRGFTVVGVPCNQFGAQEPGTADEITSFCSMTYGVTFPLTGKVDVNGEGRHPLYAELTQARTAEGRGGDVVWNFEKYLVDGDGRVVARYEPEVQPDDPELVAAIESLLG